MYKYLIVLLFISVRVFPQAAVYDVKSDVNMTRQYLLGLKDFAESEKQSATLVRIHTFYQDAEKLLAKVSRAVNDIYYVNNIVKRQMEIYRMQGYYISSARQMKGIDAGMLGSFLNAMKNTMENVDNLFRMSELILRPDYFKMSDTERIKFLSGIDEKLSDSYTRMKMDYNELEVIDRELVYYKYLDGKLN
ncbi:MAG: hypothetical protein R6W78_01205 [Bacteroidales bacterium]